MVFGLYEDSDRTRAGLGGDSGKTRDSVRLGKRLGPGLEQDSGGTRGGLRLPPAVLPDELHEVVDAIVVLSDWEQ